jgi:CheY-like chemotaxis protein
MKILVIDNDALAVEVLAVRLKTWGCTVVPAYSLDDALALAERERPDLILAEVKHGPALRPAVGMLHRLREAPALAHVPIVAHSIYVFQPGDEPEVDALIDDYLPKPFRLPQLKALIERFQPKVAV